jgi:predicted NAD/FAD-dependent oxidoreductase
MIRVLAILALSSCSATARIADETNVVRARATSAQKHLEVAQADLAAIHAAAAEVHAALPGAEDQRSQLLDTIVYVAVAGAVMVVGSVGYTLIKRIKT